jgi:hypothetical protein
MTTMGTVCTNCKGSLSEIENKEPLRAVVVDEPWLNVWQGEELVQPHVLEQYLKFNAVIIHDACSIGGLARVGAPVLAYVNMAKAVNFFVERGWVVRAMATSTAPGLTGTAIHLFVTIQRGKNDKADRDSQISAT